MRVWKGVPHALPMPVYVSLTSYPPRFKTLHLTLKCLLSQRVAADGVLLWIAHEDMAGLPDKVRALEAEGLTILPCDDLRSFKKLVPALKAYPDAVIVTADDDVYYGPRWLSVLLEALDPSVHEVLCYRGSHMLEADRPRRKRAMPGALGTVQIGMAGALYPPRSLHPLATDDNLFMRLCPTADDLWFYWMTRLAGHNTRVVRRPHGLPPAWPGAENVRLGKVNVEGGENRRVIDRLDKEFGRPWIRAH